MSVYAVCLYDTIVSAGKCNCVLATCYHIFCEHHYIIRLITSSLYINFLIDLGIQSITTLSLLNISPSSTSVCVRLSGKMSYQFSIRPDSKSGGPKKVISSTAATA